MFGGQLGGSMAGSTVVERNLDRITVVTAIVFTFTTVLLALRLYAARKLLVHRGPRGVRRSGGIGKRGQLEGLVPARAWGFNSSHTTLSDVGPPPYSSGPQGCA